MVSEALRLDRKPSAEHLIPGLYTLARHWFDRDDLVACEKILRLILTIEARVQGITAREVVLSSLDLARVLVKTDRYMEAEEQFLQTLNRCNQMMQDDHPVLGVTLREYGALLREMKFSHAAEVMEKRAELFDEHIAPSTTARAREARVKIDTATIS